MSDGMPYHFEKGPTWLLFDNFFSCKSRLRNKLYTLEWLWTQQRFTELGDKARELDPNGDAGEDPFEFPGFKDVVQHANVDWFGLPLLPPQNGVPRDPMDSDSYDDLPPWNPDEPPPEQVINTGFWRAWHGDSEEVLRTAFIRAIEVSLGLDHPTKSRLGLTPQADSLFPREARAWTPEPDDASGADMITRLYSIPQGTTMFSPKLAHVRQRIPQSGIAERYPRDWPIEFWWICGTRYFQASINWRRLARSWDAEGDGVGRTLPGGAPEPDASGRVVVILVTPGSIGDVVFQDLYRPPLYLERNPSGPVTAGGSAWQREPFHCSTRFGSWVVGHRDHQIVRVPSYEPTSAGVVPFMIPVTRETGEIVTVQPMLEDGGVMNRAVAY